MITKCLTIASSDSGGGAGVQADLRAFAAMGCFGASAIVALTAQNTVGVRAVHEVPVDFVRAQLEAVGEDIQPHACKTGMLFSRAIIETVVDFLTSQTMPIVVDPVMVASSGAVLLQEDAVAFLIAKLLPLATVVTPNLPEAIALTNAEQSTSRHDLAERLVDLGATAVVVTGGHGSSAIDHFFDGHEHVEIPVERYKIAATHGAGCTHSAIICALLAQGHSLLQAVESAAEIATASVANGFVEIGQGEGPVNVMHLLNSKEKLSTNFGGN